MDFKISDALMEIGLKCERAYHVCAILTDFFGANKPDAADLVLEYPRNQAFAFVVMDYLEAMDKMIKDLEELINA